MILQLIKYAGVGIIGTIVQYIILILLVQLFSVLPVIASTLGYITGAFVNYYLNYHFTFESNKRHHEAMLKFFIVAGIGLFINVLIMHALIEFASSPYIVAQIAATGSVLAWGFLANRIWTFKTSESSPGKQ